MNEIVLSGEQLRAADAIEKWYNKGRPLTPWIYVAGYAGSGKSTMLSYVLAKLGLVDHTPEHPGYITATFTGKAAYVQQQMGIPARTIHSLMYRLVEPTEDEFQRIEDAITVAAARASELHGEERVLAEASIQALKNQLSHMTSPQFVLDSFGSDAADCKLMVFDECSMVPEWMAADALSFGKPILVLGDPGQLPPIKGEGFFTKAKPDVMLTEIHRQQHGSPILELATMARTGQSIGIGRYGDGVDVLPMSALDVDDLLAFDQVITGLNATRFKYNNLMRRAAGFNGDVLPTGRGEKLIGTRNDGRIGFINGMFVQVTDVREVDDAFFSARIYDENGLPIGPPLKDGRASKRHIYTGHFKDHVQWDKKRHERDWRKKKNLIEMTHGWVITGHKSQGSGWNDVAVIDDGYGFNDTDRRLWLYTVITRARRRLRIYVP